MRSTLLLLFILLYSFQSWAQQQAETSSEKLELSAPGQKADSSSFADELKRNLHPLVRKSIAPSILIGWGLTHMDDEGLFEGSEGLRNVVQRSYPNFNTTIDYHTGFAPILMAVGLKLAGVKGKHHFTEQAVLLGMTYFLNRSLTNNLKSLTKINRPGSQYDDAFPSAHTSTAFAYATFFHNEYGSKSAWYSVAAYSFAAATGVIRILNDKHWLSDVLAGAGIGILSAEVAHLAYPFLQRKIVNSFKEKQNLGITAFYYQGAGGVAIVYQLH